VNVRGDALRVASSDEGKKTVHRFFTARFEGSDRNGEPWTQERYAQLQDIIVLTFADTTRVLLDALWFKEDASEVDLDTQNVFVRTELVFDRSVESLIQAEKIVNQVCLIMHPYKPNTAIVLDRKFDTLLIPGED